MNAKSGHHSLRARIANELDKYLSDVSHTEVGNRLGRAATTITRRGCDLRDWPAEELLHLAVHVDAIGDAVLTYLNGEKVSGEPSQVDDDLIESLSTLGVLITTASESLRGDRHVSLAEATRLLPIVQQAQGLMAQAAKDLSEQIRRGAA
jgi:hypothetical protein